ncbi:MAG: hypothetical protein AAGD23_00710 [Pseudomonadota bacterium]
MPEDERVPTERARDDKEPIAAGGEAITATLTGAVETISKDVQAAASSGQESDPGAATLELDDTEDASQADNIHDEDAATPGTDSEVIANGPGPHGRSRLRDAMRRARQSDAERNDVIVNLRETEIARLELLAENVEDIFDELPDSTDLFDGRVSDGNPPRLWIDVLAHVAMGRDKRTYQFVQETRQGRKVVTETTSIDQMGEQITNYVAHRMLERERALLADPIPSANSEDNAQADPPPDALAEAADQGESKPDISDSSETEVEEVAATTKGTTTAMKGEAAPLASDELQSAVPRYSGLSMIVAFLLGMLVGAITLFLIGANYTPPAG